MFPGGPGSKEFARNAGHLDSIPGSGRSPGEENGYPLQYSCLGSPIVKKPGQALWRAHMRESSSIPAFQARHHKPAHPSCHTPADGRCLRKGA